jgi:tRNA-dihydrouridine synthase B
MPLRPIQLGPVTIDLPIALAALAGYGDWSARVMARRLGAGYAVAEVLLDRFVVNVSKGNKVHRFIRVTDDDHPVAAQLMGSAAEEIAAAAKTLVGSGFDVIDVNFGCPVKKVVGKCRGGYLLEHTAEALEIVARVRDAVPAAMPVTLKMRRGYDDSPASREKFFAILDGAFQLGIAAVTVHGRTVRQKYEGPSSWAFLREVKQWAGSRIVFGSGDLFTAQDCMEMIAQTGVDGLSIARGSIGNPWIFRDVRALATGQPLPPPPGLTEQRDALSDHYRLAEEAYGPIRCVSVMSKFGIKYSRLHPHATEVRDAFVAVHRAPQWHEVLARWYPAGS